MRKVFVRRGVMAASRKGKAWRRRPRAREGVEYEQSPKRGHVPGGPWGALRAAPPTVSAPPPGAKLINGYEAHQGTAGHLDPRPEVL